MSGTIPGGQPVSVFRSSPRVADSKAYVPSTVKRRRRSRAQLAELDAAIVTAVDADHPVTVRGVYYRVVSAGAVEKTDDGYRAVQRQVLALRRGGAVPYGHITDGTRYVLHRPSYRDAGAALSAVASSYRKMLWLDQPVNVQLFTEKDAITGVVAPVAERWDVPLGVVRGYASETFAYEVASRLDPDRRTVIYQLGDHDPSGVNAWDVFRRRVAEFAPVVDVEFIRLAVTPRQIATMALPTRPTKTTDTRARSFVGESVEVDAIPARMLRALVEVAITSHVDQSALEITRAIEAQERDGLALLAGKGWSA